MNQELSENLSPRSFNQENSIKFSFRKSSPKKLKAVNLLLKAEGVKVKIEDQVLEETKVQKMDGDSLEDSIESDLSLKYK